jgi:di- and tripeptidase
VSAHSGNWTSDPFTLTARNGYLYGRGVTDNKGPVMAVACAAAELLGKRALDLDLVFLIEGEEEAGSAGFEKSVRRHKVRFLFHTILGFELFIGPIHRT